MFSFQLSADQQEFRDTVRDFVTREVKPVANHPDRLQAEDPHFVPEILEQASQMGLRTIALSEALGGAGADTLTACVVAEELAAGYMGHEAIEALNEVENLMMKAADALHDAGVRVAQLTYNTRNLVGGSCYDAVDEGLTPFGRAVIEEMHRVGMLVDLSHVGDRTCREAIDASPGPVAITHANPRSYKDVPRNKPDDVIQIGRAHV